MANIPVTPFYVPRPSEEQLWTNTLQSSRGLLDLTTGVKFFGAPGQAPTKRWGPVHTFDDHSFWNIPPVSSTTIIPLLTRPKMFGQGGQVPAKNWGPPHTFDDHSFWNIPPASSTTIIPLLTRPKLFGQGGQGVTKHWEQADLGETHWNARPIPSKYLVAASPFPSNNFDGNDDSTVWLARSVPSKYLVTIAPFPSNNFDGNDDPAIWPARPVSSNFLVAATPFLSNNFNSNSDPSVWPAQSTSSSIIRQLTHQTNLNGTLSVSTLDYCLKFGLDDPIWYSQTFDVPQTLTLTTGPSPFKTTARWSLRSGNDDPIWYAQTFDVPQTLSVVNYLSGGTFYAPRPPTEELWAGVWHSTVALLLVLYENGNQYFHYRDQDDYSIWYSQITDVPQTLSVAPAVNYLSGGVIYATRSNTEEPWSLTFQHNSALNSVTVTTTVMLQAPFYVPRQDEIVAWQWQAPNPIAVSLAVYTFASIKISYFTDPIDWDGALAPQQTNLLLAQLPQTQYMLTSPLYVPRQSDLPVWQGTPVGSNLSLPTTPVWEWIGQLLCSSYVDNPAIWSLTYQRNAPLNVPAVVPTLFRAPIYVPRQDESPVWWKQTSQRSIVFPIVVVNPYTIRQWQFGYDDSSVWYGKPTSSAQIPILTIGGIIKARQWRWDHDVADTSWNVPPDPSAIIPLLTVGGIIKARQWHWDNDDPSMWSGWANRNLASQFSIQPNPFLPVFWRFNNDDASPWRQPPQRSTALPFVPAIVDHWRMDIPDDQPWSLTAQRDLGVNTAQPKPFVAVTWRFNNDDPAPWRQLPQRSIGLPFVPAIVDRWRLDIPDDQPWSLTAQRDLSINTIQPKPFISVAWRFNNDDPPPWQQPPQRSVGLPFVPPIINHWRLDPADDQLWSLTAQYNLSVSGQTPLAVRWHSDVTDDQPWSLTTQRIIVTGVPPIGNRWRLDIPDDQPWSLTAQRDLSLTATPFTIRPYSFVVDDQVWQAQGQQRARVYFFKPEIPVFWLFNNDDPSLSWRQASQRSTSVGTLPQYPPFIIRQPSFAHDDHSSYQWPMRSEIILSLKWNIRFERIASTGIENRVVDASAESRVVDVIPENRIVDAPDEDNDS